MNLMTQSVESIVREHKRIARKVRLENQDPEKAAAFLLRAGIAEKVKKSKAHPHGVRLAKRFRT
jgi:hypothetical protein